MVGKIAYNREAVLQMTQEECQQWLIQYDSEAAKYWADLPSDSDFQSAVLQNCEDFGYDEKPKEKLNLEIEIEGESEYDLESALVEVLRLHRLGFKAGMDSNGSSKFYFGRK